METDEVMLLREQNALLREQNGFLREMVEFTSPISKFFQSLGIVAKTAGWITAVGTMLYGCAMYVREKFIH